MSDDDQRVPRRNNHQVRADANETRKTYGADGRRPVNIIKCLQSGWIPTRQGRRKLIYSVLDDDLMGNKDGKTEFTRDSVIVSVKKSVHEKATFGDGRARMTLAHELAHGVMHHGLVSYRSSGATGSTDLSKINASESAEHQAKVFASAFLIDDKIAAALHNPKEIATEFLVSLEAAEICFDRLFAESERAESAKRVQQMNEEFKVAVRSPKTQPTIARPCYLNENCTNCSQQKLIPIGSKYLCDNCGWVSDQFQDGDRSGGS